MSATHPAAKPACQRPNALVRFVLNPLIAGATRLGLSLRGSRVLAVRGRTPGEWRTTPVNPLSLDGERYLVSPRGVTHWVRNIRTSHDGKLRLGRKEEPIRVAEVPDAEKLPILRAYLEAWRAETGKFFGLPKNPTDDEIAAVAPRHPVFRILK